MTTKALRLVEAGTPAPLVDAFFWFSRGGEYDDSQVDGTAAELLGRPLRSFTDWAQAHADVFR